MCSDGNVLKNKNKKLCFLVYIQCVRKRICKKKGTVLLFSKVAKLSSMFCALKI